MSKLMYSQNIDELSVQVSYLFTTENLKTSENVNFIREEIEEMLEDFIDKEIISWQKEKISEEDWNQSIEGWKSYSKDCILQILRGFSPLDDKDLRKQLDNIVTNYISKNSGFKLQKGMYINSKIIKLEDKDDKDEKETKIKDELFNGELIDSFFKGNLEGFKLNTRGYRKIFQLLQPYLQKMIGGTSIKKLSDIIKNQFNDKIYQEILNGFRSKNGSFKFFEEKWKKICRKHRLDDFYLNIREYSIIIDYFLTKIIQLSEGVVKEKAKKFITEDDIEQAICYDDDFVHIYNDI